MPGGTEQGLCSPAVGPALQEQGTDQDFTIVLSLSFPPGKSSNHPNKAQVCERR